MSTVHITAEDISVDLLDCPFCGSTEVELSNTWTPAYSVECQECGAEVSGEAMEWSHHDEAYEAPRHEKAAKIAAECWNRRVSA